MNQNIEWPPLFILAHNLAVIGALFASFRAGDNFGFHMGADESQCTCQWAPSRGVPYRGMSRCEQEILFDESDVYDEQLAREAEDWP